jgi:hypothetical protein
MNIREGITAMKLNTALITLAAGLCITPTMVQAQHDPATPLAVAAKVALRGDAMSVRLPEMRVVRRNDILTVQADMLNGGNTDRMVFYRFKWLDSGGNQVGDGESWKQMVLMGQGQQTVKSVAPMSTAVDFRLEMNVETR